MSKKDTNKPIDFEQSLEQLEGLVTQLESGELSLQDALDAFRQGISLAQQCQKTLTEAELEVKTLIENSQGLPELAEFSPNASDNETEA